MLIIIGIGCGAGALSVVVLCFKYVLIHRKFARLRVVISRLAVALVTME